MLWIEDGRWGEVDGGYDTYEAQARERERRAFESTGAPERAKTSQQTPLKIKSQLETHIARVEREIAKIDARKAEIDAAFNDAALYEDRDRVAKLHTERDALTQRGEQAVLEWETLLERYERL